MAQLLRWMPASLRSTLSLTPTNSWRKNLSYVLTFTHGPRSHENKLCHWPPHMGHHGLVKTSYTLTSTHGPRPCANKLRTDLHTWATVSWKQAVHWPPHMGHSLVSPSTDKKADSGLGRWLQKCKDLNLYKESESPKNPLKTNQGSKFPVFLWHGGRR